MFKKIILLIVLFAVVVISHPATSEDDAARSTGTVVKKPHLILLLADDFGWANVGFHRNPATNEVQTPNIDQLANNGVIFDRFYTYKICSPSRSSLQSGRLAQHVNALNVDPLCHNPNDPVSGYAGIPRNMTGIAEKLKQEGYRTIISGKWDVGMATPRHTPLGRGYDHFLGYFHHANDYWTGGVPYSAIGQVDACLNQFIDLWQDKGPARSLAGSAYEEDLFLNHTLDAIFSHDTSAGPLYLFHSFHLCHTPLQVPDDVLNMFSFIDYKHRQQYAAMVYYMDKEVGAIVNALKTKKMYSTSLILFFSDNGGPIYNPGSANNYPLRGGKYSDFEGGIRVNAFASGGLVPSNRRGAKSASLVHVSDVFATFIRLAHFGTASTYDATALAALILDTDAAAAGLPPVDSLDTLWPAITGTGSSGVKRQEIHISAETLISGNYKLITGTQIMSMWTGPYYPNTTGQQPLYPDSPSNMFTGTFSYNCTNGCLFDVFADPTEHDDLASSKPDIRDQLYDRLMQLNEGNFNPERGEMTKKACLVAYNRYEGFYGPFVDLSSEGEALQEYLMKRLKSKLSNSP